MNTSQNFLKECCADIILGMEASGIKDLIPSEWTTIWDDRDCLDLVANYGHHYLSEERMTDVLPFLF